MTHRLDFSTPPKIQLHKALAGRSKRLSEGQTVPRFEATIDSAPLDDQAFGIFRALNLSIDVLEEADLLDVAFAPSDDED